RPAGSERRRAERGPPAGVPDDGELHPVGFVRAARTAAESAAAVPTEPAAIPAKPAAFVCAGLFRRPERAEREPAPAPVVPATEADCVWRPGKGERGRPPLWAGGLVPRRAAASYRALH